MQTLRRNDPCPCGSGKKYKHCCLKKEETQAVSDWSQAVPRAIKWLMAEHPHAVREALDNGFFGSLDENEGKIGCWGATEQKTGLSKFQATSSKTSAGFLNGRNSPRVTASGTEKA